MSKVDFLTQLKAAKIPEPVREYRFDEVRRWRFDYAWLHPYKVALEVEGGAFSNGRHTRGKGFIADLEKYNEATACGWKVLRVTPQQLIDGTALRYLERLITIKTVEAKEWAQRDTKPSFKSDLKA